jgi:Xylanase inhibitor C-terminal/Xylanase inhibitor N-terminal
MNTKLLLFLVLLCFPTLLLYTATGITISESTPYLGRTDSEVLLHSAVNYAVNAADDTMPDISVGKFIVNISVGGRASPQNVPLIIATTFDYTFMLCQPCGDSCSTTSAVYDPSRSDTYSNFTCDNSECPSIKNEVTCSGGHCKYNYTDLFVSSEGYLVKDTFSIGNSSYSNIAFGCGITNTGNYGSSIGFLGLGVSELSLSSLADVRRFSYCPSSTGDTAFALGSGAEFQNKSSGVSTQLFYNTSSFPQYYLVNFTGVSIGGQHVDIPSDTYLLQPDGTGGMILATTLSYTYLEESAYNATKDEFVKQMSSYSQVNASPYGLDLCFAISPGENLTIPQLTLHFDDGAEMNPTGYFGTTSDETVGCLLMLPSEGASILGSYMQLDMQIIYDIDNSVLQFDSTDCGSLLTVDCCF